MHQGNIGNKLVKRDADHVEMWQAHLATELAALQQTEARLTESDAQQKATIRELSQTVEDLRHSLKADMPTEKVRAWLESDAVREASRKRDSAFRARDRALAALWSVDALHDGTDDPQICRCGKPAQRCEEYQILGQIRTELYSWENKQVARKAEGKEHYLPTGYSRRHSHRSDWEWED